jgi:hypothetical protein
LRGIIIFVEKESTLLFRSLMLRGLRNYHQWISDAPNRSGYRDYPHPVKIKQKAGNYTVTVSDFILRIGGLIVKIMADPTRHQVPMV